MYFLSFSNPAVDELIRSRPEISVDVVVTDGEMIGRKALIKGVTDDTSIVEFIRKVGESFNLKNSIVSFYFPLHITVIASIRDSIECYGDTNNLSIYSLCVGGNKSVSMIVHNVDEMIFDINMKVNNEYDVKVKDIKGSECIKIFIEKIREECYGLGIIDYLKIGDVFYKPNQTVSDIIPISKIYDIACNINSPKQFLYLKVSLIPINFMNLAINVDSVVGGKFTMLVDKEMTLDDFKNYVQMKTGFHESEQRVIFKG